MTDTADRRSRALVVVAIVVLAVNLRPAVNSVGSALPEIRAALGLSATTGGALTSLPPLCFALLGLVAPVLAGRFRTERVVLVSLVVMTGGQFVRILGSVTALFAGSFLTLAGLAICNVLMPSLIRRYFPDRIGTMTAVYTTGLAIGATSSSAFTVPIERSLDADWRTGLGVWGVIAAIAVVPWLAMLFRRDGDAAAAGVRPAIPVRDLLRSRVAWLMGVFFGLQAAQAYNVTSWLSQILVDDGADLQSGGYAVAVFASLGIPISVAVPALVAKQSRLPYIVTTLGGFYIAGYLGLMINPAGGMWLWAVLIGIGSGTFPLVLTLIVLRARTAEGVAALSAFAQCMGYLLAAGGPLAIGWLHDRSGGWTLPIGCMAVSVAVMIVVGLQVAKPRVIEDDLAVK